MSSQPATNSPPSPLRTEALRADPSARAYLIVGAGREFLGTLADARAWFPLGYDVRDPETRERVDIGASAVPAYAEGAQAFGAQREEEEGAREGLAETEGTAGNQGPAERQGDDSKGSAVNGESKH